MEIATTLLLWCTTLAFRESSPELEKIIISDYVQVVCTSERHLLANAEMGWTPGLRQPNKTLFAVRCKLLDRQDHCTAF